MPHTKKNCTQIDKEAFVVILEGKNFQNNTNIKP